MEYTYILTDSGVLRSDGAHFPKEPGNRDYNKFIQDCLYIGIMTQAQVDAGELPTPDGTFLILQDNTIDDIKFSALLTIDKIAGAVRSKFITVSPGQELTYQEKAEQAADFAAANYPTSSIANYPFIQVEISVTGLSVQAATDGILAKKTSWIQNGALIEEARLIGKRDINAATDAVGITTALNIAITALNSIS
jgi:hypothetical protein